MNELKKIVVKHSDNYDYFINKYKQEGWEYIDSEPSLLKNADILTFKK